MKKPNTYAFEYEFFVTRRGKLTPAYKATSNLDGDPFIGELRTKMHQDPVSAVFELRQLIWTEKKSLRQKGYLMSSHANVDAISPDMLKQIRADSSACDLKEVFPLEELSVYEDGKTGNLLSRFQKRASLQLNFSKNSLTEWTPKDADGNMQKKFSRWNSNVFDFRPLIYLLDDSFSEDIVKTDRVPGVFAIKHGDRGERIEYRSLPSNVNLDRVATVLYEYDRGISE